jgi:hypothetical protein
MGTKGSITFVAICGLRYITEDLRRGMLLVGIIGLMRESFGGVETLCKSDWREVRARKAVGFEVKGEGSNERNGWERLDLRDELCVGWVGAMRGMASHSFEKKEGWDARRSWGVGWKM